MALVIAAVRPTPQERLTARSPHLIVCRLTGHQEGWLTAKVPNPHALSSHVWGCLRCRRAVPNSEPIQRVTITKAP